MQYLIIAAVVGSLLCATAGARGDEGRRIVGLYVHQHWPYNHPYAARTWTMRDWRGWAEGCRALGYNTFLIWPMLETIPDPPTPSDRSYLKRLGQVVDMLHRDFDMRVYFALCPNIVADDAEARRSTFQKRHYYYCDRLVDPADPDAMQDMLARRERLLRQLSAVDGISIIDSDPGCYPGSTNEDFVRLLVEHRRMLNRIRPEIELIYWMHAGWLGWSRFYETGKLALGTAEEQLDALRRLKAHDPAPWGLANGLGYAEQLGIADKVISFNYGRIEGEPSYPMTNFGGTSAYDGGAAPGPRGVMGNAQTHCVQLPNIFAFAQGARGAGISEADYVAFADRLVEGKGAAIVAGWKALAGTDPDAMRSAAAVLEGAARSRLQTGPLGGLLFGSPSRFLTDLVLMLRQRAAMLVFASAVDAGNGVRERLADFVDAAGRWQKQHGYQCNWYDPVLRGALHKMRHPAIDRVLAIGYEVGDTLEPGMRTAADQVRRNFSLIETYTTQLLAAMRLAARSTEQ